MKISLCWMMLVASFALNLFLYSCLLKMPHSPKTEFHIERERIHYDQWITVDVGMSFPELAPLLRGDGEYHEEHLKEMLECAANQEAFENDKNYTFTCNRFLHRHECIRGKDWELLYYVENIFRNAGKLGDVLTRLKTQEAILAFVDDLETKRLNNK